MKEKAHPERKQEAKEARYDAQFLGGLHPAIGRSFQGVRHEGGVALYGLAVKKKRAVWTATLRGVNDGGAEVECWVYFGVGTTPAKALRDAGENYSKGRRKPDAYSPFA